MRGASLSSPSTDRLVGLSVGGKPSPDGWWSRRRPRTDPESEVRLEEYRRSVEQLYGTRYIDYPMMVGIETLAVCNAACGFCPYPTMDRKGDRMSDGLVSKILSDMGDIPDDLAVDVNFTRVNEPFLDKRLFGFMDEYASRIRLGKIWLFTNASAINARNAAELAARPRIGYFLISFNDHRREEYERVMRIPFERTVANIDRLHVMLAGGELAFTPIISRVGDGSTADVEFEDWVRRRWPLFEHQVTHRFDWLGAVDLETYTAIPQAGCLQWFQVQILASGDVTHCAVDHDATHGYGRAQDTHLLDLYNLPERRSLRAERLLRSDVGVCRSCNHFA